jgi:transcriptional regulator with XRE-family HTH domain
MSSLWDILLRVSSRLGSVEGVMEESVPPAATTQAEVIAERVNQLFAQYKQAHGRKATDQQVADYVREQTGKACSRHWVRDLRNADIRGPELARLEAIASFFGVAPRDLFDERDADSVEDSSETARRVNLLFSELTEPDGSEPTDQQVADHIVDVTGQPCSADWVADLRAAKIRAPEPSRLEAIASFFGVARRYLFDDTVAAGVEEDIATGRAIKYLKAHDIHLRNFEQLRPDQLSTVAALVRTLAEQNQRDRHDRSS